MATITFTTLDSFDTTSSTINTTDLQIPGVISAPFTVTFTSPLEPGQTFTIGGPSQTPFGVTYEGSNGAGDVLFASQDLQNAFGNFSFVATDQSYTAGQQVGFANAPFTCFLRGALIRTPKGDVPVETLESGDLVVTNSGEIRPVKWVGHRDFDLRARVDARPFYPVRIAGGAFGPNRPSKDLMVSAGHSICIDLCGEVMIPAGYLINGSTIAQVEADEVSYWHVELDTHDVLLANGLPAESYLAMENRAVFEEAGATVDVLDEGVGRTHADFCRPVVLDGPVLAFVRERLTERAEAEGWTASRETDLALIVDGEVHRPVQEGKAAVFAFPAAAREVSLVSNTFVPTMMAQINDARTLGICLLGLSLCGSDGERRVIRLDDERVKDQVHPEEAADDVLWRWTKGEMTLDADLWSGLCGPLTLVIELDSNAIRRWIAPSKNEIEVLPQASRPKLRAVA